MNNNFMQNQYGIYGCFQNCENCPFYSRTNFQLSNSMGVSNYNWHVNDFWRRMPEKTFWRDNNGLCHTGYEWLQDYLVEYCRINYPWRMPINMEVDDRQVVYISDVYTYEKYIKDIFKKAIDIAAEVTKDRNPQLSIMFDRIGLVLADDVNEAVKKVFSILDKVSNITGKMR